MNLLTQHPGKDKISPVFADRLARLAPSEKIQAIVLLQTPGTGRNGRRQPPEQRKAALEAVRRTAARAIDEIDRLLASHDGQRISPETDALGSVVVETTVAGIGALAESAQVRAILENQPILPAAR